MIRFPFPGSRVSAQVFPDRAVVWWPGPLQPWARVFCFHSGLFHVSLFRRCLPFLQTNRWQGRHDHLEKGIRETIMTRTDCPSTSQRTCLRDGGTGEWWEIKKPKTSPNWERKFSNRITPWETMTNCSDELITDSMPSMAGHLTLSLPSSKIPFSQPLKKECITEVGRSAPIHFQEWSDFKFQVLAASLENSHYLT